MGLSFDVTFSLLLLACAKVRAYLCKWFNVNLLISKYDEVISFKNK